RLDGLGHGLVVAAQMACDRRGTLTARARQHDLASSQREGIAGAQASFDLRSLSVRHLADKYGRSHTYKYATSPPNSSGIALGVVAVVVAYFLSQLWEIVRPPPLKRHEVYRPPRFDDDDRSKKGGSGRSTD